MDKILHLLYERAQAGQSSMLITVTGDAGSAPRGTGAYMITDGNERLAGTIGGGMLEYKSVQIGKELFKEKKSGYSEFRLTKDEVAGLGMVCGGNVDVLYTYIPDDAPSKEALSGIEECIKAHKTGWMILPKDGGIGFYQDGRMSGLNMAPNKKELESLDMGTLKIDGRDCFVQKIKSGSRAYIFGGGHLGQELTPLLSHLGFRCIVTDDREEYSAKELFPGAEEVLTADYNNLEGKYDITPDDYVIIVTRGHVGDYTVEKYALTTPAGYIGVVGSKSKTAEVNAKLKNDGFTDADIARVTTPIGLDIKSETPAEIAVSVAAQLIKHRAESAKLSRK